MVYSIVLLVLRFIDIITKCTALILEIKIRVFIVFYPSFLHGIYSIYICREDIVDGIMI